jgi:hypothetical protein
VIKHAARQGLVIGMGIDFGWLREHGYVSLGPQRGTRAYHIVRLSPYRLQRYITIESPEFAPDYPGKIAVFDDSLELGKLRWEVEWLALKRSARGIKGALWMLGSAESVRRQLPHEGRPAPMR